MATAENEYDEPVWSGTSAYQRKFHTNESCEYYEKIESEKTWEREVAEEWLDGECNRCQELNEMGA